MTKKTLKNSESELAPLAEESLGEYLRRLRLIRGLDLGVVAARTPQVPDSEHISNSYLSQLELGRARNPSRERLRSLARVLEVPEEWILEKAGFSSGHTETLDSLDPDVRNIALRASQLDVQERSMLEAMLDGILRRKRR